MENKIVKINNIDDNFPQRLLNIQKPPKQIYAIGNINLLENRCVAIVGSRDASEYGKKYTKIFANELAKKGITIVSGLAIGIDTIAHENSIFEKGKTIAVIASGFNNIYPKENIELFNKIIENDGLIISEYEPNKEINLSNFPTRNRIISALAECVIVTEAKARSGSQVTARHAKEQNKKVLCLPGRVGDIKSRGTNDLIKKGAGIITSINDVFEELGEELIKEEIEKITIKKEYKELYNIIKNSPININELSRKYNIEISELNVKITMMELEGLIETVAGNIIRIKE